MRGGASTGLMLAVLALLALPCAAPAQERFALVIGVAGYPEYSAGRQLSYADDDALAFASFIRTPQGGGFPAANVKVLTNQEATRDSIVRLIRWLEARVHEDDILYVFFAGHGQLDLQGRLYFMPYDASPREPTVRGYEANQFFADLIEIQPAHLVFFVDACHAGQASMGSRGDANLGGAIMERWRTVFQGVRGDDVRTQAFGLMASMGPELSHEDPEFRHGVFTHYLLEGLAGVADMAYAANGDGVVTAGELHRYVLEKVSARVQARWPNEPQTPALTPDAQPRFPLAVLRGTGATLLSDATTAREHYRRGAEKLRASDEAGAIAEFNAALRIDPGYSDARDGLGRALDRAGRRDEAVAVWRETAARDPTYWQAHLYIAGALVLAGDTTGAIGEYRRVLAINRDEPATLSYLASLLRFRSPDEAWSLLKEATRIEPDTVVHHLRMAFQASDLGYADAAIEEFSWVIRRSPPDAALYYHLGMALNAAGDMVSATTAFRQAVRLNPDLAAANSALRTAEASLRAAEDSVVRLRSVLRANPDDGGTYYDLAWLLHTKLFRFDEAVEVHQRWLATHPGDHQATVNLAAAYFTAGRHHAADTALAAVLANSQLTLDRRIALTAVLIANQYAMGHPDRGRALLPRLRALAAQKPAASSATNWNFSGTIRYIRYNSSLSNVQGLLIQMLRYVASSPPAELTRNLNLLTLPARL